MGIDQAADYWVADTWYRKVGCITSRCKGSPLYGTFPAPRVLQNHLDHGLECMMMAAENDFLEALQMAITRRNHEEWIIFFLAISLCLRIREVDIWRLMYWFRHPEEANSWRHPENPATLVARSLYSSNCLLTHFRCLAAGWIPLGLDWNYHRTSESVAGNTVIIESIKRLQDFSSERVSDLRAKKAFDVYVEGDEHSLDSTLTSLMFAESVEILAQVGDFVY
ncbi:hypothetical protein VTL71DRAFT_5005 [Oculimacula yallundae]|uniref:Uncharacterized protein n=1 Tax=Oculimacula yallundae TaxID=86028 RepID=A0ABR4C110_9HELO